MTARPCHPIAPLQPNTGQDCAKDDALRDQWLDHRSDVGDSGLWRAANRFRSLTRDDADD